MLKVGDRVRFKEDFNEYPAGYEAEVIMIDDSGDPEISGHLNLSDCFFMDDLVDLTEVVGTSAVAAEIVAFDGPTLLDQFAMAALTGLLANPADIPGLDNLESVASEYGRISYIYAHAMMRARSEVK